jgi:ferredoxin-type protein NapF
MAQRGGFVGKTMTAALTRRNLLRAFAPSNEEPGRVTARIGAACVEPRGVTCRRCGEACDAGAIRFRPARGGASVLLDVTLCTGCGECAPVCPVSAISFVNADRAVLAAGLAQAGATP